MYPKGKTSYTENKDKRYRLPITLRKRNPLKKNRAARSSYNLTEAQVRYAIENTMSNSEAARFLGISRPTWFKYASMYIDPNTGLSLYKMHCNTAGKGMRKNQSPATRAYIESKRKYTAERILAGEFPGIKPHQVKPVLIKDGYMLERCAKCGFSERRVHDKKVPLILNYKDGDYANVTLGNLELLCYNCYYLYVGNIRGMRLSKVVVLPSEKDRIKSEI